MSASTASNISIISNISNISNISSIYGKLDTIRLCAIRIRTGTRTPHYLQRKFTLSPVYIRARVAVVLYLYLRVRLPIFNGAGGHLPSVPPWEQRNSYACFHQVITMRYKTKEEILKLGEIDPELAAVSSSKIISGSALAQGRCSSSTRLARQHWTTRISTDSK